MSADYKMRTKPPPHGWLGRTMLLTAGATILSWGLLAFQHDDGLSSISLFRRTTPGSPVPMQLQGITFSATTENLQRIATRADAAQLCKRKMGLLRFGMTNEAIATTPAAKFMEMNKAMGQPHPDSPQMPMNWEKTNCARRQKRVQNRYF